MAWRRGDRWVVIGMILVATLLAGSILVGIENTPTKRWVFEDGFTVDALAVSRSGDYFATASHAPDARHGVLHFFRADHIDWNATTPRRIQSLDIAASGALVVAGLQGGGLSLHTGRGEALGTWPTTGPVRAIDMTADGALVAAATELTLPAPTTQRGGLLLYRLGQHAPILHVPKVGAADVGLSETGDVLVAAFDLGRTTEVLLYDRALDPDHPYLVEALPGSFRDLGVSDDGRHVQVVTDRAAFLLARAHDRPVGIIPERLDPDVRPDGGALAEDGQSHILVDADRTRIRLYKWGEDAPRWTRHAPEADHYRSWAIDSDGDRVVTVTEGGALAVLSVTTGRPIKEIALEGDPGSMIPSANGRVVLATDADGRLYRASGGHGGLLGVLPDPLVSTLYAQPAAVLWFALLAAVLLGTYPVARPLLRRAPKTDDPEEPDHDPDAALRVPLPQRQPGTLTGPISMRDVCVARDRHTILRDVRLDIAPGTLTAVVGGSGEGKSTLLDALLGRTRATGTIRIGAIDPHAQPAQVRRLVGHVPQELRLYPNLDPRQNLYAFGGQYDIDRATLEQDAERMLRLVGIDPATTRPLAQMSGGERRRVSIAAALLPGPALLVLDEPTTGLDPLTRRRLWRLLTTLRSRLGVTIISSTHYLEEAEEADQVVVLEGGRVVADGTPATIVQDAPGGPLLWRFQHAGASNGEALAERLRATLAAHPGIADEMDVRDDLVTLRLLAGHADAARLVRILRQGGIEPLQPRWVPMGFEDAFIAHLAAARRAAAPGHP